MRVIVLAALVALVLLLFTGAALGLHTRRVLESRASRARTKRGLLAERGAEKLLASRGYRVLGRQVAGSYRADVDGEDWEVTLTADLLVERSGRELVAEVKTGAQGTRLSYADTRRQMLEYQLAFGVEAVLLVDADARTIREVRFPWSGPTRAVRVPTSWLPWGLALVASGSVALWFALR